MVWIKVCVQEFPSMHVPRYLYLKAFVCIQDVIYVSECDHALSLDPDIYTTDILPPHPKLKYCIFSVLRESGGGREGMFLSGL